MNHGRHNDTTHSVGLNGSAFEDRSLNWSVLEGYNTQDKSTSGNLSVNYRGSKGDVAGGYGYDRYSNHYNYSLRGAWSPMRADSRYHAFLARVLRWSKRPASAM